VGASSGGIVPGIVEVGQPVVAVSFGVAALVSTGAALRWHDAAAPPRTRS
jgi:hypothetical protein